MTPLEAKTIRRRSPAIKHQATLFTANVKHFSAIELIEAFSP